MSDHRPSPDPQATGTEQRTSVPVLERPRMARATWLRAGRRARWSRSSARCCASDPGPDHRPHRVRGRGWLGHRGCGARRVRGAARPIDRPLAPSIAAMRLGAVCWLACLVGAWLVAMAILPGSSRTFPDRLAATPFLDWVGPQLGAGRLAGPGAVRWAGLGRRPLGVGPGCGRPARDPSRLGGLAHERHPLLSGRQAHPERGGLLLGDVADIGGLLVRSHRPPTDGVRRVGRP